MRLHHFDDAQIVRPPRSAADETTTLESGVTRGEERRLEVHGRLDRPPEPLELVDFGSRRVTCADDEVGLVDEVESGGSWRSTPSSLPQPPSRH